MVNLNDRRKNTLLWRSKIYVYERITSLRCSAELYNGINDDFIYGDHVKDNKRRINKNGDE